MGDKGKWEELAADVIGRLGRVTTQSAASEIIAAALERIYAAPRAQD